MLAPITKHSSITHYVQTKLWQALSNRVFDKLQVLPNPVQPTQTLKFGPSISIKDEQVFLKMDHVFAMVNLKPMVPGHVLVCPKRVVQNVKDLTKDEVS